MIRKFIVGMLRLTGVLAIWAALWLGVVALDNREAVYEAKFIFAGTQEDADCSILISGDNCIMIDTGEAADAEHILDLLKQNNVDRIDCMILTHPDQDHVGGASYIIDEIPVTQIVIPYFVGEKQVYNELMQKVETMNIPVQTLSRDRLYSYGDVDVRVFSPEKFHYNKSNDYSLAVLAEHGDNAFFLAGDAQKDRIEELFKLDLPEINVYKTAYHGRDTELSGELIEKLKPEYAVVTAAEPEKETGELFRNLGTEVISTIDQDCIFVSDGEEVRKSND